MKTCPKCGAEAAENARFCLYCMTSFEGKATVDPPAKAGKGWLYIAAALLLAVLVAVGVWLLVAGGETPASSEGSVPETSAPAAETPTPSVGGEPAPESQPSAGGSTTTREASPSSGTGDTTGHPTGTTGEGSTGTTTTTTGGAVSDPTDTVLPVYSYVEATLQNAYPTGYTSIYAPENAVVITKVEYVEPDGHYVIPDTIDGKKVAALMPGAFGDSAVAPTVKSVTLPATVRTIWSDAFEGCYNLKDLYLKSGAIGIYTDAFPAVSQRTATLTIHCKRDCRDFDFYYYRNIAGKYDAVYEEWNG